MPWKEKTPVDLRMEFMTRLGQGERMTDLCREYGISRKTGHKLKNRYEELGVTGLLDQSRAPKHVPHKTAPEVAELLIGERRRHPAWGPKKLKDVLEKRLGHALPSASTIGSILFREGLVERRAARRRYRSKPTQLSEALAPNDIWCVDYKGQFRLGDQSYCYPLTVTDQCSRYLLCCDGMPAIDEEQARASLATVFRSKGLPLMMRSDNGTPFASTGLKGLTKLSVFWLRLGIRLERTRPAHPQDNGRHERMHRTLKMSTTRPARSNLLQQQEAFDSFVHEFNHDRPHEALDMKRPAQLYMPSSRPYPEHLPEPDYRLCDDVIQVTSRGNIHLPRRSSLYLSTALAGQPIGIREEQDGRWLLCFIDIDLGHVDSANAFIPLAPPPATN